MLNLNEEEIKSILQNRIDNREGPLWDLVKKVDYEIKVAGRDFECIAWIEFKNHLNEKTLHIDLTHNGYMILHAKFNDEMDNVKIIIDDYDIDETTLHSLLPYSGFDYVNDLPF